MRCSCACFVIQANYNCHKYRKSAEKERPNPTEPPPKFNIDNFFFWKRFKWFSKKADLWSTEKWWLLMLLERSWVSSVSSNPKFQLLTLNLIWSYPTKVFWDWSRLTWDEAIIFFWKNEIYRKSLLSIEMHEIWWFSYQNYHLLSFDSPSKIIKILYNLQWF
jgi:hypothetical protein